MCSPQEGCCEKYMESKAVAVMVNLWLIMTIYVGEFWCQIQAIVEKTPQIVFNKVFSVSLQSHAAISWLPPRISHHFSQHPFWEAAHLFAAGQFWIRFYS